MRMTRVTVVCVLGILIAAPAATGALPSDILYLLPRESGVVAFIDLLALRASPHYQLIKQHFLPPRIAQFDRFVRTMGIETDKDMDWLAWGLVPAGPEQPGELFLGLAQGQFKPERVEESFRQRKLSSDLFRGQTIFPMGSDVDANDLLFTFLDSSTIAFGTRAGLELLLETRYGTHESLLQNSLLLEHVQEANGRAPIWVALDEHYTRLAVRQLVPEAAKFPEFERITSRFRTSLLRLTVERELTLDFHAWCAEPADAQSISLLLQTGFVVQNWQSQKTNPPLSAVLGTATVRTAGERVEVQMEIDEKDLRALLEQPRPFL